VRRARFKKPPYHLRCRRQDSYLITDDARTSSPNRHGLDRFPGVHQPRERSSLLLVDVGGQVLTHVVVDRNRVRIELVRWLPDKPNRPTRPEVARPARSTVVGLASKL
jgi:hypothetical protein